MSASRGIVDQKKRGPGTCQRGGCDLPAGRSVEWVQVDEPLAYCEAHAKGAVRSFSTLAELVDPGMEDR